MKLTILGSGVCSNNYFDQDLQLDQRYPPAYLLEFEDNKMLFECSELVRFRLEQSGFNYADIQHLAISHAHPDHFALVHYIQSVYCRGLWGETKNETLNIYCPEQIEEGFEQYWRYHLPEMEAGERYDWPELKFGQIYNQDKTIGDAKLSSYPVYHGFGRADSVGFRLETEDSIFGYSGDTGVCVGVKKIASSADLFLCEASVSSEYVEDAKDYGHLTPPQVGEIADKGSVKHLVVTHYPGTDKPDKIVEEIRKAGFEGQLDIAGDFDEYTF
ncbi:MAG: MBL fold metallo-hydrolase [Candidatus Paceibacteria bacterium]